MLVLHIGPMWQQPFKISFLSGKKILNGNIGGQNFKDEIYISNDFT